MKLDFFLNELKTPIVRGFISNIISQRVYSVTDLFRLGALKFGITDNNGVNFDDFLGGEASDGRNRILHLHVTHLSNSYGQRVPGEFRGQQVEVTCSPGHPVPDIIIIIIVVVVIIVVIAYQERLA